MPLNVKVIIAHIRSMELQLTFCFYSLKDIDECDHFSPCDQICSNTEGSFNCSCNEGYELSADTLTSSCQGVINFIE